MKGPAQDPYHQTAPAGPVELADHAERHFRLPGCESLRLNFDFGRLVAAHQMVLLAERSPRGYFFAPLRQLSELVRLPSFLRAWPS